MTEQLTYVERYIGNCRCYLRTVSDGEAELESRGVLVGNQSHKARNLICHVTVALGAPQPMAACVGGWISSKRPRTLPDRASVSSGNGSCRHG